MCSPTRYKLQHCSDIHDCWTCFIFFNFRVFLALSEDPKDRGTIVAQGGGKVSDRFRNVQVNLWHSMKSQCNEGISHFFHWWIPRKTVESRSAEYCYYSDKLVLANYSIPTVVCYCAELLLCPQALIPLALEGTDAGKVKASHALAKIAAISNPEIAFPGERVRHTTITPLFTSTAIPFDVMVGEREWKFTELAYSS